MQANLRLPSKKFSTGNANGIWWDKKDGGMLDPHVAPHATPRVELHPPGKKCGRPLACISLMLSEIAFDRFDGDRQGKLWLTEESLLSRTES